MTLKNILYVEDEVDIQEVARLSLEMVGGFSVKIASSGQEAIHILEKYTPDLILLDVMMPGINGITTLHMLRELPHTANIPVIFMTAKVQPHEIENYQSIGTIGVISKPFDPMELSNNIKDLWNNHMQGK